MMTGRPAVFRHLRDFFEISRQTGTLKYQIAGTPVEKCSADATTSGFLWPPGLVDWVMPSSDSAITRIAICTGLAGFLYQFEASMTTTALPVLAREVPHLSGVISLVPVGFLVGATMAMVPAGRLARQVGFHRILCWALVLMAMGTLLCYLASNAGILIIGRWVTGLGGGSMASAAYGLVASNVPSDRRRGVFGWVTGGVGIGMVVGAPLGGAIADWFSWRMLFLIQIPILVFAALAMGRQRFPAGEPTFKIAMGWNRSLTLGIATLCACMAGSLGRETGWLSLPIVILAMAALLIFSFLIWSERVSEKPLFPREVWQAHGFWRCWRLLFACSMALGGALFLVPFYLHEALDMTVAQAAGWMSIQVISYSLAAFATGRLQGRLYTETQALIGIGLALAGVACFATGGVRQAGLAGVVVGCALIGAGLGLAAPAINACCVARLPESQRISGAALLPLGLNLGSVAGVIATAELREAYLVSHITDYGGAFLVVLASLMLAGIGLVFLKSEQKEPS